MTELPMATRQFVFILHDLTNDQSYLKIRLSNSNFQLLSNNQEDISPSENNFLIGRPNYPAIHNISG